VSAEVGRLGGAVVVGAGAVVGAAFDDVAPLPELPVLIVVELLCAKAEPATAVATAPPARAARPPMARRRLTGRSRSTDGWQASAGSGTQRSSVGTRQLSSMAQAAPAAQRCHSLPGGGTAGQL
jgi:hypothetical protein